MKLAAVPVTGLLLSLAACATPPVTEGSVAGGSCQAEPAAWAIGRGASPEVVERARIDTGSSHVRVIEPGQVVTMDFRHDRLNIDVNERGAITGLRCG